MNLYKLQNGSDIRGVALEGIEGESVNLTEVEVSKIAKGFKVFLSKKFNKEVLKIAVGSDSRLSSPTLKAAICKALSEMGCEVFDCHLASTPSLYMSTKFEELKCDGAIMITASHLPYNRNGMKFFDIDGGLNKLNIKEILDYAHNEYDVLSGSVKEVDLISLYSDYLNDIIKKRVNSPTNYELPLKGLKIVVDAGNGVGGFYATKILKPLGADIEGSQFLEPDGTFPNHIPNPEDEEAMKAITSAVLNNKADLGLIFDTDVDRSSAVFSSGQEVNRNGIIALAASIVSEDYPNTTIVTDSVTSDELAHFINHDLKCKHHRFKRGYKNVIDEAVRLNNEGIDAQLAIETSGHAALKENFFLDDGAYLATKIVIKAAKMHIENRKLDELIKDLKMPLEEKEIRLKITNTDFQTYGSSLINEFLEYANNSSEYNVAENNYEGVRVSFDQENGNGWALIRQSLHDPILPINIESNTNGGTKQIALKLLAFLDKYEMIDITNLKEYTKKTS